MAALHEAFKTLGPLDFSETPLDNLKPFLSEAFSYGQLMVDSVPIPAPPTSALDTRPRSSSNASSSSEISLSHARAPSPSDDVQKLQKEWKPVKLGASQNPLGMNVYKCGGKDGKGAWFARRSVHEGLGFTKWKRALEREFPETMKVQGGPGEGNIRGIGGERRVEFQSVDGVGKMEVFLLSAQFPGPTTPRDFVTMFLTSDQALKEDGDGEVPRHFMVISRPCLHEEAPARDGFIRGYYESVEFIREIPIKKKAQKSASTTNLLTGGKRPSQRSASSEASELSKEAIVRNAQHSHPEGNPDVEVTPPSSESDIKGGDTGRARGRTISFDKSRGFDAKGEHMDVKPEEDEAETNPIEWIMITRSDPGGSVPRFMIERGTPGGIVSDASKFLDWACAAHMDDLQSEDGSSDDDDEQNENGEKEHNHHHQHKSENDLHNWQTNGHLAGIEEVTTPTSEYPPHDNILEAQQRVDSAPIQEPKPSNSSGLYSMAVGAAGIASEFVTSYTPHVISDHLPSYHNQTNGDPENPTEKTLETTVSRKSSISSTSSVSSVGSFASALERYVTADPGRDNADASSQVTTNSEPASQAETAKDRQLQKLSDKKRKLDEKLSKVREKELSKKREDNAKEEEAIKKAEEAHEREVKKQEEKFKREVEKLELKKQKEQRKAEEKKRKAEEKVEKTRIQRELDELKAENEMLKKETSILRLQVGELQAENTTLAARVGKLGAQGEEVLRDVRQEVSQSGRLRASSLKGLGLVRRASARSNTNLTVLSAGGVGDETRGKENNKLSPGS